MATYNLTANILLTSTAAVASASVVEPPSLRAIIVITSEASVATARIIDVAEVNCTATIVVTSSAAIATAHVFYRQIPLTLRRFLRDPSGKIWTDADLLTFWNDAQIEIAQKTQILKNAELRYYPPKYAGAYLHDWELAYAGTEAYKAIYPWALYGWRICHPWEMAYDAATIDALLGGDEYTQPWESGYCNPGEPVHIRLSAQYENLEFVSFDEEAIQPTTETELAANDRNYKTRSGQVLNYYPADHESRDLVLYPRPSSITWDDTDNSTDDPDTSAAGKLLAVYRMIPTDWTTIYQTTGEYPRWMLKFILYGCLERAYGADTDGYIPSLRDYWKMRKEVGINALKRYLLRQKTDRHYRLGGGRPQTGRRHPALPAGYPKTWP